MQRLEGKPFSHIQEVMHVAIKPVRYNLHHVLLLGCQYDFVLGFVPLTIPT